MLFLLAFRNFCFLLTKNSILKLLSNFSDFIISKCVVGIWNLKSASLDLDDFYKLKLFELNISLLSAIKLGITLFFPFIYPLFFLPYMVYYSSNLFMKLRALLFDVIKMMWALNSLLLLPALSPAIFSHSFIITINI